VFSEIVGHYPQEMILLSSFGMRELTL